MYTLYTGLDMSEEELITAGGQLKIANNMHQKKRDINASTPIESEKQPAAGADSELAKKLERRRQRLESQPQNRDKIDTPPAHHSQRPLSTCESSELAKKLEIRRQRSEPQLHNTDKLGTPPAHHSQQPLTTGEKNMCLHVSASIYLF